MKMKWKRALSYLTALTVAAGVVTAVPVAVSAEEEMVDVFNVYNADFDVKSSTGMKPQKNTSLVREGDSVFDRNIITTTGTEMYDGIPLYDVNGKTGNDYIVLMDISTTVPVPLEKLKVFWETGTPYQDGPVMYKDKPTRAWAEGFEIYVSDTGADNSWELVYQADTLEGKLQTEVVSATLWDDSNGVRPFYEFELTKPVTAKYIRMAIRDMQPWLGDIQIHEIYGYTKASAIDAKYHTIHVNTTEHANVVINSSEKLGENLGAAGSEITLEVTPDSVSAIHAVKVDGKELEEKDGKYFFTMPDKEVTVDVDSGISDDENVDLVMESASVVGGDVVPAGTVPVITMNFNRRVDFVDKSMVLFNGERNSDLIQHAFKDANDPTKVYIVPFSDKLEEGAIYTAELADVKSMAGKSLSGRAECSFQTAADYQRDIHAEDASYIKGYGDGAFGPEDPVTVKDALTMAKRLARQYDYSSIAEEDRPIRRVELAKILYILKNGESMESLDDMFSALVEGGIFRGYEDGTFRKDSDVTRAETVTLFNRVIGRGEVKDENTFTDVPADHWAVKDIVSAASDSLSTHIKWTENIPEIKSIDTYNEKNHTWTKIPAITQKLRDMGIAGGEGGQWMQALEIDNVDGSLMLAGIDVTGMIRSTDGGKSWQRSYRGFTASGCVDIKIDPNNKNRILAIGSLSDHAFTGIYMSDDMGENWHHVYSYVFNGQRDTRNQLAWDKSTYDESIGGSRVAYWSNLYRLRAGLENSDQEYGILRSHSKGGLVKTEDGGKTWNIVNKEMSDSVIAVHPTKGIVYAGNESGFFRSEDGGVTFTQILSGEPIYGLDVIETRPDNVYINDSKGVLISEDCGKTFKRIEASGFPKRKDLSDVRDIVRDLAVSPANPDYMLVDDRNYHKYNNKRYYTHDGGKTWAESGYDSSRDFFFNHSRQHPYAWHPTDENKVWTFGGDWVVSSQDGGESFIWDNNGNCGTPPGGRINFNPFNTDLIFCGAQDLTGLLSTNRGYTFVPIESEGGFGCAYGNYAVDENLLVAAIADGWYGLRKLHVSRDGGLSFKNLGLDLKYGLARRATSFWGSPKDRDTIFAGEYVSHDRADTWKEMTGCQFVMAVNYYHNKEAYGLQDEVIVVSYDNGDTWYPFSDTYLDDEEALRGLGTMYSTGSGKHCWDIEYDGINDILYYANGSVNSAHNLVRVENNVHKNIGGNVQIQEKVGDKWYQLIALDPRHPDVLYLGGYGAGAMKCSNSVQRSCDRGESFQIISSMGDNKSIVKDGESAGSGAETIVVHPEDGTLWLWAAGEGLWTFPAPYEE